MIVMKAHTTEERYAAIKEIEASPIKPEEWEGPHETRVTSFKIVDDTSDRKKKGILSRFADWIKAVLHPV